MVDLLRKCEEHKYAIYDQVIPQATTFNYLGIPFKQGGHLDAEKLVQNNILKAMPTMDALSSIGLKTLEEAQNKCIRKIYGASEKISTKVMLHLAKSKLRTPNCYPAVDQQSLLTSSCGYQWLMKKEIDVYVGALVVYRVKPPNPVPVIPAITCQDDTPLVASIRIPDSVCLKQ
ncbi:hypothetical protein G6F35_011937 [Rhizopus arrhizus]|nr:hypothetical protein G6F35_011937 [Rhizopus arrhizus]